MIMCPSMYTVVSSQLRHTMLMIAMILMIMCPSKYTVVSSQLRHTILMIVMMMIMIMCPTIYTVVIITVTSYNFDDSDDYVP